MASTVTARQRLSFGSLLGQIITLDTTSYVTNGEDVSSAGLGLSQDPVFLIPIKSEKLDQDYLWDTANKKLKIIVVSTGAELANAADGGTCEMLVLHRGGA